MFEDDRGTVYSFTASRGSWSTGVLAHDLAEAKRKLEARRRAHSSW